MKKANWRKLLRGNTIQRDFDEIKKLAIRYIKEETVQPLKDLGRFVLWGALGSLLVGFGYFLLLLGALRFLQVGSSRVDLQACKLEYSIVSPK